MTIRRERHLNAAPAEVWRLVCNPARLPEWWPGVTRVEDATPDAWTVVLTSAKGRAVRADYTRTEAEAESRLVWRQELEETPFERILAESATEIVLHPDEQGTRVELALRQRPRGWARFSPFQFRGAARRQVQGALDGLGSVLGAGGPGERAL